MAVELRKQNVACISLWPGAAKTERIQEWVNDEATKSDEVSFNFKWERFPAIFKPKPSCFSVCCRIGCARCQLTTTNKSIKNFIKLLLIW